MKLKMTLIVVILLQAVFGVMSLEQRIIINKYQVIEEPIKVGRVSSFGNNVEHFAIHTKQNYLELDEFGMLTINSSVKTNETSIFKVLMKKYKLDDYILSTVYLTVTILTDEIIENNALVIFKGVTSTDLIASSNGPSKYEQLISFLNKKLNIKSCNESTNIIDARIFAIQWRKNPFILNVRFTVTSISEKHNQTYFHQDKLRWVLLENRDEIIKKFNIKIKIGSDVCLVEEGLCESSCRRKVKKVQQFQNDNTSEPLFVGPVIDLESICEPTKNDTNFKDKQIFNVKLVQLPGECYNVLHEIKDFESMDMSFDLISDSINGTVLYFTSREFKTKTIFLLQLVNSIPTLMFSYGNKEHQITLNCFMNPSVKKSFLISFRRNMIQMTINKNDNCRNSTTFLKNDTKYNFNFVLQYGTTLPNIQSVAKHFNWTYKPQPNFINGTISDLKSTIFHNQDFPEENNLSNEMRQNKTSDWLTANIAVVLIVLATIIIIVIILVLIVYPCRCLLKANISPRSRRLTVPVLNNYIVKENFADTNNYSEVTYTVPSIPIYCNTHPEVVDTYKEVFPNNAHDDDYDDYVEIYEKIK